MRAQHEEILVHSGQHYDYGMSDVFFEELGIPEPDYHMGAGGGSHAPSRRHSTARGVARATR